jgi:hypothetical protein
MMLSSATVVRGQQQEWARRHNVSIDSAGYTRVLDHNLFMPLSPETRAEFARGDGGELGRPGERGKMQALHSSSALTCNVFEYWRGRDAGALARALMIDEGIASIAFERKYPTGLPGHAPNLDVVLTTPSGRAVAIECKFLEPFGAHGSTFKPKYFAREHGLWREAGFPGCQALAERLYSGETVYKWLYAEQLPKHILGLQKGAHERWALLYLWYEVPGVENDEHAAEAEAFGSVAVGDGIDFRTISYQSVFNAMEAGAAESDHDYLAYLGERYFGRSD